MENSQTTPETSAIKNITASAKKTATRKRNANYAIIHKDALPLSVHPLPGFHPTQPLSLLYLVWTYLQQVVQRPSSHNVRYTGYYSTETRSVHITDPVHIRALWEKGFFGKGTLSRSEPTWLDREVAQQVARQKGDRTAEEVTRARREERRLFKLERARAEREKIDKQISIEQGTYTGDDTAADTTEPKSLLDGNTAVVETSAAGLNCSIQTVVEPAASEILLEEDVGVIEAQQISNQEHLQLTLEEAFFLRYALGVLDVQLDKSTPPVESSRQLFDIFKKSNAPFAASSLTGMDDSFTLNYVVYHHFRSLGWVVRGGVKFSVDFMLYNRGPVFSHAEFAVLIMPTYSHQFWKTETGRSLRRIKEEKNWWFLHCINRVQAQVMKTLILCYVDIPPPPAESEDLSVTDFLRRYKVREFAVRRWLMNRSRD